MIESMDKSFSLECWVRLDNAPTASTTPTRRALMSALADVGPVEGGAHIHNARGWWLGLDEENRLTFGMSTKDANVQWHNEAAETVIHSSTHLVPHQWYYIVVTYDSHSGIGKIYSNGRPVGSRSLGKNGVFYGASKSSGNLPPLVSLELLRYKDRNVDNRVAASIGDVALWNVPLKAPVVATAAISKKKRDATLVAEATLAVPSKSLIAFFRFDQGFGNVVTSYGYTNAFLSGTNPTLEIKGPTTPQWIADSESPPPALPVLTKQQRGKNEALSKQTSARLFDIVTDAHAEKKRFEAALAIPAVVAAGRKAVHAKQMLEQVHRVALKTGDQLDTARAYEAIHRNDNHSDPLAVIVRDLASVQHSKSLKQLIAAKKKADQAIAAHNKATEAQRAIASTAQALADGYSVLHDLSKAMEIMIENKAPLETITKRLQLGIFEIHREMSSSEKERRRTWLKCSKQGSAAHLSADKTAKTLRKAKAADKIATSLVERATKQLSNNQRMTVTLQNLNKHVHEQMAAARVISVRSITKQGKAKELLAQHLLQSLDTTLGDIADEETQPKKSGASNDWLSTLGWLPMRQKNTASKKTTSASNFLSLDEKIQKTLDPYSRRGVPLRSDYSETTPLESVSPSTNYSKELDMDASMLRNSFNFPFANQAPDQFDQFDQADQADQADRLDQATDEKETKKTVSTADNGANNEEKSLNADPHLMHVTTNPEKLKFHESWKPSLKFASEIRGMLSHTSKTLSDTVRPEQGSTAFSDMLSIESEHVAQALQRTNTRHEQLVLSLTAVQASSSRAQVHTRNIMRLLKSQKEYYSMASAECETKMDVFEIMSEKRAKALAGVQHVLGLTIKLGQASNASHVSNPTNTAMQDVEEALANLSNMSQPLMTIRSLAPSPIPLSLEKGRSAPLGGKDKDDHSDEECAYQVTRGASAVSIADLFGVSSASLLHANKYIFVNGNALYPSTGTWIHVPAPKNALRSCKWAPKGFSELAHKKEALSSLGFEGEVPEFVSTVDPSQMTTEQKLLVKEEMKKLVLNEKLKTKEQDLQEKQQALNMLDAYLNESKRVNNGAAPDSANLTATAHNAFHTPVPKDLSSDLKHTLEAASVLGALQSTMEAGNPPSEQDILTLSTTEALPVSVRSKAVNILNVARKSMKSTTRDSDTNTPGIMEIQDANATIAMAIENKEITVKMVLSMPFGAVANSLGTFKSKLGLTIASSLDTTIDHVEVARVAPFAPLLAPFAGVNATAKPKVFGVDVTVVFISNDANNMTEKFVHMLKDSSSSLRESVPFSTIDITSLEVTKGGEDEAETFATLDGLNVALASKVKKASSKLEETVEEEEKSVSIMENKEQQVENEVMHIEDDLGINKKNETIDDTDLTDPTTTKTAPKDVQSTGAAAVVVAAVAGKTSNVHDVVNALKKSNFVQSIKQKKKTVPKKLSSSWQQTKSAFFNTKRKKRKSHKSGKQPRFKTSMATRMKVSDVDGDDEGFLKFNGGDYLDMGVKGYNALSSGMITDAMTVATWVRVHEVQDGKYSAIVSSVAEVNQEKKGFLLGYGPSKTLPNRPVVWVFGVQTQGSATKQKFIYVQSNVRVKNNDQKSVWTHVAGVLNNNVLKLYVNGKITQKIPIPEAPSSSSASLSNSIDFETKESDYQLKPKLILMSYAVNGAVPPPPCCAEADLSDTGIWSDALTSSELLSMAQNKRSSMAQGTSKQPMLYLDLSSRFMKHHTMLPGSSQTFQAGSIGGALIATYVTNDEASSVVIHTEKKSTLETMEEQGSGMSLEQRKELLHDLTAEDSKLLKSIVPSVTDAKQVNEAQIAFALAVVLGGGEEKEVETIVNQHEIMAGPSVSVVEMKQLMKQVIGSTRITNKQLGATLLALPKATSFVRVANILHGLLIGNVPTVVEPSNEATTSMGTKNDMVKDLEKQAETNADIKLMAKSQRLAQDNEKVLSSSKKELNDMKKALTTQLQDAKGSQERADTKMSQAVSLGKAVANQHAQMNGYLSEHGFLPLENEQLADNNSTTIAPKDDKASEFKDRVKESAAVAISRLATEALHEAKARRDKLCAPTKDMIIALCEKATREVEEAEEVSDRASTKLTTVSNGLRAAVNTRNGKYSSYLNSTATTAASIEKELQQMIHNEATAHMLARNAATEGNSDVAKLYDEQALALKKNMETLALRAVALRTHGIMENGKSPLLSEAEERGGNSDGSGGKAATDPQWLAFVAHNIKLELSSKLMDSEIEVKKATSAVEKCQRERTTMSDDDCQMLLGDLSRAKANLLVVRTKVYSINGLFSKGMVGDTTDREVRLEKEKDSIVTASRRMNDQKIEAQTELNGTKTKLTVLKDQLKQEQLARMYSDGVIEQMTYEINGTDDSYVRVALRFQPKISPDSKEFGQHVIVALALAFNTTESRIKLDLVKELSSAVSTTASGLRGLRRRLLSAVERGGTRTTHRATVNDVLIHVRVLSDVESVQGVERTVRLATAVGGDLEQMMLQEGVGVNVIVLGAIEAVVRGSGDSDSGGLEGR